MEFDPTSWAGRALRSVYDPYGESQAAAAKVIDPLLARMSYAMIRPRGGGDIELPQPETPPAPPVDTAAEDKAVALAGRDNGHEAWRRQLAPGMKEYGPGVAGMKVNPVGPPQQEQGFGKTWNRPQGGGNVSMMQVSGNTPTAERLEIEPILKAITQAKLGQELEWATKSPEELVALKSKPDPRMWAIQQFQEMIPQIEEQERMAEASLLAEAKQKGIVPRPEIIEAAKARVRGPVSANQLKLRFLEQTMTGGYPPPFGGGLSPQ